MHYLTIFMLTVHLMASLSVIFIHNRVTLKLKFELAAIRRVQSIQNISDGA